MLDLDADGCQPWPMRTDPRGPGDRLIAYLAGAGHRAWWVGAGFVGFVLIAAFTGWAAGFLLIAAIQLAALGLVIYVAVRLALRHQR